MSKQELLKKFGKSVKIERIKREISQEKFAELSFLDRTTIYKIEKGKSSPNLDTIIKIANALNININELLSFDDL